MASPLQEKIGKDLNDSVRAKDSLKSDTLRLLLSSVHNREIEKRSKGGSVDLTDEEVLETIGKEAKKRKEAIDFYKKGDRAELAEKESSELKILEAYLPESLGEEEIKKIIGEVFDFVKPASEKDFGRVMGEAMKRMKGRVDGSIVTRLIKEKMEKP